MSRLTGLAHTIFVDEVGDFGRYIGLISYRRHIFDWHMTCFLRSLCRYLFIDKSLCCAPSFGWSCLCDSLERNGKYLPCFVKREFEKFLSCGDLREGFAWLWCRTCDEHKWIPFSCKRRWFCPSCCGNAQTMRWVDSVGLKWTQLNRVGLLFGHNLDTVWSFLWVWGLPLVWLAGSL